MQVRDVMTRTPVCCMPSTALQQAAQMMCNNDCGELPVVESKQTRRLIGVITDRDICCRGVANGWDVNTEVAACMSRGVETVGPETDIKECCRLMQERQIRRIPVVDQNGACCGIVSQADLAQRIPVNETGKVVREVSQPHGGHAPAANM